MSSLPRAAMLRQQQRAKEAEAQRQQTATMPVRQQFTQQRVAQQQQQAKFSATNRQAPQRRYDRSQDLITAKEYDEMVEQHENSGKCFRTFFLGFVMVMLLLLAFAKWDVEVNLEVPQIESGRGFGEVVSPEGEEGAASTSAGPGTTGVSAATAEELAEIEKYYETLGVSGRLRGEKKSTTASDDDDLNEESTSDDSKTAKKKKKKVDPDLERRRENRRVRKQLKKAYDNHLEERGQLVACGRNCEAKHQQVQMAYVSLSSKVDRELYGVLHDTQSTKTKRTSSLSELKEAYENKKKEIIEEAAEVATDAEASEADVQMAAEDREMALEELKDAFDILSNPEARGYYHIYGQKPPEFMKHMSARHGGWGQEIQLGTFKARLVFAWIDYLKTAGYEWGESAVIGLIILFVLVRIPVAVSQASSAKLVLEAEEDMNHREYLRSRGRPDDE